jgi:hypothetical protein
LRVFGVHCVFESLCVQYSVSAKAAVNEAADAIKDRAAVNEMRSRQKHAQALDRAKGLVKKMQKDVLDLRQLLTTLIAHPTHNLLLPLPPIDGEEASGVLSPSASAAAEAARAQQQVVPRCVWFWSFASVCCAS